MIEIIPTREWYDVWAEKPGKEHENLVYDVKAIKRERDRRAAIENALRTSDLFHDPTLTEAGFEMCLNVARQLRHQNLKETDLELAIKAAPLLRSKNITTLPELKMCLSAPDALNKIRNDVQEWYETGNAE